eukprot:TRINITY_DN59720_c0_g1_i1.p1 TRINITY_DN59720_c0_g1~~TRINITY_DN59720_c0_g1_i1.p1  ORF type:complete len:175 (-),score=49.14 TRINITY_DN59720_c0_g1_i1:303-827(-)
MVLAAGLSAGLSSAVEDLSEVWVEAAFVSVLMVLCVAGRLFSKAAEREHKLKLKLASVEGSCTDTDTVRRVSSWASTTSPSGEPSSDEEEWDAERSAQEIADLEDVGMRLGKVFRLRTEAVDDEEEAEEEELADAHYAEARGLAASGSSVAAASPAWMILEAYGVLGAPSGAWM